MGWLAERAQKGAQGSYGCPADACPVDEHPTCPINGSTWIRSERNVAPPGPCDSSRFIYGCTPEGSTLYHSEYWDYDDLLYRHQAQSGYCCDVSREFTTGA